MLNSISVMGRLTSEPNRKIVHGVNGDQPCAEFTIANKADYGDHTNFIRCEAWRRTADFVSQYFHKGELVCVNGSLTQKNGFVNGEQRSFYTINVNSIYFTSSRSREDSQETPVDYGNQDTPIEYEAEDLPWD